MARKFDDFYIQHENIGQGPFTVVKKCSHKLTRQIYAVKIVDYKKFSQCPGVQAHNLSREITICHSLKHPHIVELFEVYEEGDLLYLVFEYMEGADLCVEIVGRTDMGFVYSEAVTSHYMFQILDALRCCHEQNILHRDIKPHCALLLNKENSAPVKLGGFGYAIKLDEEGCTRGRVGTEHFMAPEVINDQVYGKPADIWSCGVLLYILVSGTYPFLGTRERLHRNITNGNFNMTAKLWDSITDPCKNLIARMLNPDQKERITIFECLQHPWIRERDRIAPRTHLVETVNRLKEFNARRFLKVAVIEAMRSVEMHPLRAELLRSGEILNSEEDTAYDSAAIDNIIDALEECDALWDGASSDKEYLDSLLREEQLSAIIDVFEQIRGKRSQFEPTQPALNLVKDLLPHLNSAEAYRLKSLFSEPDFLGVLQAHDVVAEKIFNKPEFSPEPQMNGWSPTNNHIQDRTDGPDPAGVTRVRLVQFMRRNAEPLGITLRSNPEGHCVVARIIHGGMIHKQGTMRVGDEIREINEVSTENCTIDSLQQILKELRGNISLKIVPSLKTPPPSCEVFVRAQFSYTPTDDDLIPCREAGISFDVGDILHIISKDDHNWWQALVLGKPSTTAGLIPSPELQEWRITCLAVEKTKSEQKSSSFWFGKKKKPQKDKYVAKHNAVFDRLEVLSYEEVVRVQGFKRKTLVLLGAHGVGRRHIKSSLIASKPNMYSYPVPHTSRPQQSHEEQGKSYYFVSQAEMMQDIQNNHYLEYGTHENALYGTKLDTIRKVNERGQIAILDVEPQALKFLRNAEFSPYVIFFEAPDLSDADIQADESLLRLQRESKQIKDAYQHLFDLVIVNNDIEDAIKTVEDTVETIHKTDQWVPASWVF